MKMQYIKPEANSILFSDPLMLDMVVSQKRTSNEASRESKFGEDEHDTEDHENFWEE